MIDTIYLCAGVGKRADLGYPKQFLSLQGKPLLIHGLETLRRNEEVGIIIIACPLDNTEKIEKTCKNYDINNYIIYEGGDIRQDSVFIGLSYVTTSNVLICEGVRPFMTDKLLAEVVKTNHDFVVPINKCYATVLDLFGNSYNRNEIGAVQMPQKYETRMLLEAHIKAKSRDYTDDSALVINELQKTPLIIHGPDCNIKITTPLDIYIAEAIAKYLQGDKRE